MDCVFNLEVEKRNIAFNNENGKQQTENPKPKTINLFSYIKFLWHSTNEHGVHSPFVYSLLTECLYKKENKPAHTKILEFRKALLKDEREIEVTDFGAGSRVFKSNTRKVSAIAKNAGISKKRALLLNKLTYYLEIKNALELGTSVGISSAAIALGNNVKLTTIEGCPETAKVAAEYFQKFGLENIHLEVGSFEKFFSGEWKVEPARRGESGESFYENLNPKPQTTNSDPQPTTDLIYFDGNHQKEATLRYFHQLLPMAHNDSVFIFDDIHWSKGMEEAWEEIKNHPQVRVTIDSFFWGLVFFRKEQEKEHFIIRL